MADVDAKVTERDTGKLYAALHGAREQLCLAQQQVPSHWRSDVRVALDEIDLIGSALCPALWSRFDQPEYPTG